MGSFQREKKGGICLLLGLHLENPDAWRPSHLLAEALRAKSALGLRYIPSQAKGPQIQQSCSKLAKLAQHSGGYRVVSNVTNAMVD